MSATPPGGPPGDGSGGDATLTPAQAHTRAEVLRWGQPRPRDPELLAGGWARDLEAGLARFRPALHRRREEHHGRPLVIGRGQIGRALCPGLQHAAAPFVHNRASVRSALITAAVQALFAAEGGGAVATPSATVVERIWTRDASASPGDPRSRSSWLNRQGPDERGELVDEVAEVVDTFRELWPPVAPAQLVVRPGPRAGLDLAGGCVRLVATPALVVDSPVDDGAARALLIDLRTGRPRPPADRDELRFLALAHTLLHGQPPFRWVSLFVTEGRHEGEDLSTGLLDVAVARVVATVEQVLDLEDRAAGSDDLGQTLVVSARSSLARTSQRDAQPGTAPVRTPQPLTPGVWCSWCPRREDCPVAFDAVSGAAVTP